MVSLQLRLAGPLLVPLLALLQEWRPVVAQAPGDYDDQCRNVFPFNQDNVFPADFRLLLDSFDYLNLFGTALPAIWLRQSFDEDASNVSM